MSGYGFATVARRRGEIVLRAEYFDPGRGQVGGIVVLTAVSFDAPPSEGRVVEVQAQRRRRS